MSATSATTRPRREQRCGTGCPADERITSVEPVAHRYLHVDPVAGHGHRRLAVLATADRPRCPVNHFSAGRTAGVLTRHSLLASFDVGRGGQLAERSLLELTDALGADPQALANVAKALRLSIVDAVARPQDRLLPIGEPS